MTKINKIVMQGFKSFAKRTEILFHDNFNCVLGPNGAGKSNVLDALCFVLGKASAKGLRAEKSSNLIHNGGKSKKPAKEGEVSIYFDNSKKIFPTEEEIVKITRIITQSGQSKYKINDQLRTRQQILDLLATVKIDPDGYNIILQGDIIGFVEMSTHDRRLIIEEVSGISVYEDKKQKAVRELEKVDEKLNEAEIILKERKTYLQELKKDRDQALKYKNISDKIMQNKASYLKIQINKKETEKKKREEEHDSHKSAFDEQQDKIKRTKQQIENNRAQIRELTKEVEEKGEKEQVELQKQIEKIRVGTATHKTRIGSIENELSRINQRKEQLRKNLGEIEQRIGELSQSRQQLESDKKSHTSELQLIQQKIDGFKKKHKIDQDTASIDQRMEQIDKDVEELQKEVQRLREEQQEQLRKKDKTEFQIQTVDNQIEKVQEIEKEHRTELEELKQKRESFKRVVQELNKALERSSQLANSIKNDETKAFGLKERLEKLSLQQTRVVEQKAASLAVKKILEEKNKFGKVYGTVAELGKVKSKYTQALEVAAGARINNIVVETDVIAARCIQYLRSKKLGVATFLPLNKLRPPAEQPNIGELKKRAGVHGLAIELITFDPQFQKVFSHVFGNTLVVDDINTARKIGVGTARMVTLTGDVVELSGAMQGGFRQRRSTTFQEEDVSDEISKLKSELVKLQNSTKELHRQQEQTEKEIDGLREQRASLEGEIIKTEKSLHLKSEDLEASKQYKGQLEKEGEEVTRKINELGEVISGKNKKLTDLKIEKQQLKDKIGQLRSPTILAELTAFDEKRRELQEAIGNINTEVKGINMQVQEILGRDQENTQKILKDIDKEEAQFKEELGQLQKKVVEQQGVLKDKEAAQQKYYVKFKELYAKRNKLTDENTKFERVIDDLMEKARKDEYNMNTASLELARINAELAGLNEEFHQYEGVELDLSRSEQDLKKEIGEFEKLKENIGSVNLRALDVYEAVEKEYNSLVEKREKLLKEKEDVVAMMNVIEAKKQGLFMKNFENINENFKQIFAELSSKGEAYLDLENPEKPFEEGVQIKVKITGNKFMDIRSLSGGEKTLTALAFIFSIQEYEPASFYILDEVDAALDKHNSEKFAKLIRKYAEKAQYVIISHNDAVLSEADALYGVSMNEHGVSNVVSLKI